MRFRSIPAALCLMLLAGCGALGGSAPDASAPKPGVIVGSEWMKRDTFISDPRLQTVSDLQIGKIAPGSNEGIVVAGERVALLTGADGSIKQSLALPETGEYSFVPTEQGAQFLSGNSRNLTPTLVDHEGNVLWTKQMNGDVGPYLTRMLPFHSTKRSGFVMATDDSVRLLDANGQQLWRRAAGGVGIMGNNEVLDDGQPTVRIVGLLAGAFITLNEKGSIVGRFTATGAKGIYDFHLIQYPADGPTCLLVTSPQSTDVYSVEGATKLASFPAQGFFAAPKAAWVKLRADGPSYLAMLAPLGSEKDRKEHITPTQSELRIYDGAGALVYREVIGERCNAILAINDGESGRQTLLVGGAGKVYRYSASSPSPSGRGPG